MAFLHFFLLVTILQVRALFPTSPSCLIEREDYCIHYLFICVIEYFSHHTIVCIHINYQECPNLGKLEHRFLSCPTCYKSDQLELQSSFPFVFLRIKWRSTSIFGSFMVHWIWGFWRETWLSHQSFAEVGCFNPISIKRWCIYMISHVARAIALYSDFTLDWGTTFCFLLLYDIKFTLIKTIVVVGLLSVLNLS